MRTFLLLINTVIWGTTFFVIKGSVNDISPTLLVAGRTLIAAIVMLTVAAFIEKNRVIEFKVIRNGAALGLLLAATYLSQTLGLRYTSSGHSAFITGAAVVMVPLLLKLYFRTTLSSSTITAVLVVAIGLFALSFDLETKINIGDAITIITALSYAHHLILSGKFVKESALISLVGHQFLFAAIFSLAVHFFLGLPCTVPDKQSIIVILYLGLFGTLFCYFISVWAQRVVSATKVAVIFSLESVFAAIFGYFMLNEVLSTRELIGAVLVLAGVMIFQICQHWKNNAKGIL